MEMQSKAYVVVLPTMNDDPEEFVFLEEEDDELSHWEIIHSYDSDGSDSGSDTDAADVKPCSLPSPLSPLLLSSPRAIAVPEMVSYGDDREPSDEDMDDDDDGYGCDLDDELIPRGLSGKFGRQRMRKLGKRAFSKMNNSKRSPFLYMKPGCVHGKHGFGLKHSF